MSDSKTTDEETPNEVTKLLPSEENEIISDLNISDDVSVATNQQSDYVAKKVNKPFMYVFFRIQSIVCVVSLAVTLCTQALPGPDHKPAIINLFAKFYIVVASIIGLIVELELSESFLNSFIPIFRYWFVKGLFYVLLALLGLQESGWYRVDHALDKEIVSSFFHSLGSTLTSLVVLIASAGLFVSGALYVIFGALFLQGLKAKSEETYQTRLRESVIDEE